MVRKTKKKQLKKNKTPELCKDCYRWSLFGIGCRYYWKDKAICGSKVADLEEMEQLDKLRYEGLKGR